MSATFPGQDRAKHMGELKRGDERWDVFVEMQPDAEVGAVRGRVLFLIGEHVRNDGCKDRRQTVLHMTFWCVDDTKRLTLCNAPSSFPHARARFVPGIVCALPAQGPF